MKLKTIVDMMTSKGLNGDGWILTQIRGEPTLNPSFRDPFTETQTFRSKG